MSNPILDDPTAAITRGDVDIFRIAAEMPNEDRGSLLAIQNVVRRHVPAYTYLEVGSALGGSLLPHLADPACRRAYSVDPRPPSQPDERGRWYDYSAVSTERMRAELGQHLPAAALAKLRSVELTTTELTPAQIDDPCDLIFIDAEHTNIAVFQDFLATRRFAKADAIVAFHDSHLLFSGLMNIACLLHYEGVQHRTLFLPQTVFVVLLGAFVAWGEATLAPLALEPTGYIDRVRQELWSEITRNNPYGE